MNEINREPDDVIDEHPIPTMLCELIPSGNGYRCYCMYCDVWHQHGAEEGHAWAHCFTDNSPYREPGYMLVELPEVLQPVKRYRPRYARDGRILSTHPDVREKKVGGSRR